MQDIILNLPDPYIKITTVLVDYLVGPKKRMGSQQLILSTFYDSQQIFNTSFT